MSTAAQVLPVNPATVEQMAFAIADRAARSDIELDRCWVEIDGVTWFDLSELTDRNYHDAVLALRYMRARGDVLPYRVICHPNYPFLRRFEARC